MVKSTALYDTLSLQPSCSASDIRRSYLKLALKYHPDKVSHSHSSASLSPSKKQKEKEEAEEKFKSISRAYEVLSDEQTRKVYDSTGVVGRDGEWTAEKVGVEELERFRKEYVGSEEEKSDLLTIFNDVSGSFPSILERHISFGASVEEEERLVSLIRKLISSGEITNGEAIDKFESDAKDEKARKRRLKKAEKEAKEAEAMAKEMGIYDQLYGVGSTKTATTTDEVNGKEKKAKGKGKKKAEDDDGDVEGLKALIAARGKGRMDNLISSLEEKYVRKGSGSGSGDKKGRGKKRKAEEVEEEDGKAHEELDLDEEAFQRIQEKFKTKKEDKAEGSKKGRKKAKK
ncbi:DnaJ-domain-containing protein [Atractiella rhizophila]|nr:DnaJ-domain-containing protein [Atractiella rhizophila]